MLGRTRQLGVSVPRLSARLRSPPGVPQPFEERTVRQHPCDRGHDGGQDQRSELIGKRDHIARSSAENPVCDATSGDAVMATFFRKSASTPQAMNGIIAT